VYLRSSGTRRDRRIVRKNRERPFFSDDSLPSIHCASSALFYALSRSLPLSSADGILVRTLSRSLHALSLAPSFNDNSNLISFVVNLRIYNLCPYAPYGKRACSFFLLLVESYGTATRHGVEGKDGKYQM